MSSSNRKSNTKLPPSLFAYKSCYRLYAGHGNWINLSEKTTQELLAIFQKGEPCRYQLAPGLFLSIIPNDVDCNSKNIDMIGLMRADLVYDSHMNENHAQQALSHYVRSILDDQGIIDAFPPVRAGQDLPAITALSTHRHLSLVPSMAGTVRRGPKPGSHSSNTSLYDSNSKGSATSSSASSFRGGTDEDNVNFSSSNSSLTQSSLLSSANNRKRNNVSFKKVMKKPRLDTIYSFDIFQRRPISPLELSTPLPGTSYSSYISAPALSAPVSTVQLTEQQNHPYYSHNNSDSTSSSNSTIVISSNRQSHMSSQSHNDHYYSSQPQTPPQPMLHNPGLWLSTPYQQHSTSSSNIGGTILPTLSRLSNATTQNDFNINFGVEFDHRQSPTNILNEYDNNFSTQINSSTFDAEVSNGNNGLYPSSSSVKAITSTSAQSILQHQSSYRSSYHQAEPQQHQQSFTHTTTPTSSNTNSLENLLPTTSPISLQWSADIHQENRANSNKDLVTSVVMPENEFLTHHQQALSSPPPIQQPGETTVVDHWHQSLNSYIETNNLNAKQTTKKINDRKASITTTVDMNDAKVLTGTSSVATESKRSSDRATTLFDASGSSFSSEDNGRINEGTATNKSAVGPIISDLIVKPATVQQAVATTCIKQEIDNGASTSA